MAPMTRPSGSRRADALSVVGITSPLALRGFSRALRVTPFATTSRRAAVNSRVSSGLMKRDSDCSIDLVRPEPEQLGDGVVGLEDLALQVRTNTGSGALAMMISAANCRWATLDSAGTRLRAGGESVFVMGYGSSTAMSASPADHAGVRCDLGPPQATAWRSGGTLAHARLPATREHAARALRARQEITSPPLASIAARHCGIAERKWNSRRQTLR